MARSLDFHRAPQPKPTRPPASVNKRSSNNQTLLVAGIVLVIVILAGTHLGGAKSGGTPPSNLSALSSTTLSPTLSPTASATMSPTALPTQQDTPTETPSTTPTPSVIASAITKQSVSLRILNGTGTAGQANVARHELEAKGWNVRLIAVANTTRGSTIVYYRDAAADLAHNLAADLGKNTVLQEDNTIVGTDDILVVIGRTWSS